ncbi:hypothetical protein JTE90_009017 [Oedothorax gibbosus]|uniref:Transmembrane protein 231 n=1 Tax=Oedothorax gibbosus TaxID=931172 RepID=A0AAV6VLQ9_9ARAC|nr:hypothetical protein JTE90_009017 [Oedothorax gibbosus]
MAVYEVFSQPLAIKYKSSLCSKSTCFCLITSLLSLICPFLISYYTQGFWKKVDVYREQPDVSFKHKMLLVLETKSPQELIFWSTYKSLNQLINPHSQQIVPSIEHREEDFNMDGKRDELQMTIEVPLTKQDVVSVKLILIFDYKLYLYSNLHMESAIYIHYSTSLPGSAFSAFGELSLHQREPLSHTGQDTRFNNPVIEVSSTELPPTRLENILLSYSRRNVTTSFQNVYPVWEAGRAANESFKINLVVLYPEVTILYRTGFWQLIKWALVQYMAIFIIFSAIVWKLKSYVFEKQWISTIVTSPVKSKT